MFAYLFTSYEVDFYKSLGKSSLYIFNASVCFSKTEMVLGLGFV